MRPLWLWDFFLFILFFLPPHSLLDFCCGISCIPLAFNCHDVFVLLVCFFSSSFFIWACCFFSGFFGHLTFDLVSTFGQFGRFRLTRPIVSQFSEQMWSGAVGGRGRPCHGRLLDLFFLLSFYFFLFYLFIFVKFFFYFFGTLVKWWLFTVICFAFFCCCIWPFYFLSFGMVFTLDWHITADWLINDSAN